MRIPTRPLALLTLALGLRASAAEIVDIQPHYLPVSRGYAVDVAPTEDGTRAYVLFNLSPQGPEAVGIVDVASGSQIGTFDAAPGSYVDFRGGAVAGNDLYIAGDFRLVRVDLDTLQSTSLFDPPPGQSLHGSNVVVSALHHVYAVAGGSLLEVDPATAAVVHQAALVSSGFTLAVAVSADETAIYVVDSGTGVLRKFDGNTFAQVSSWSFLTYTGILHYRPSVLVGPDGLVYVGYVDRDFHFTLATFDPEGTAYGWKTYGVWSEGLDFTRDGTDLLDGNGDFIDRQFQYIAHHVTTGFGGYQVHVARNGRRAFVSDYNRPTLVVIDLVYAPRTVPIEIRDGALRDRAGVVPVAILSEGGFDATTVDPLSVCFGEADAAEERSCSEVHGTGHPEDVDGDGDLDLMLHFRADSTGIDPEDAEACLTGQTLDGEEVTGCDAIRWVGRSWGRPSVRFGRKTP